MIRLKIVQFPRIGGRKMDRVDEIIYKETQKAAYEEQCEQGFVHQEQPNEDYFEDLNDYLNGTMII